MSEKKPRRITRYYCHDCRISFDILTWFEQRRKYCPKCGDYWAIRPERCFRNGWSPDDIEILDKYIRGEVKFYAVVEQTGKSIDACRRRKSRRIRELGLKE